MLTRRSFLSAVSTAPAILTAQSRPRPNILFIAIDDLNDWIGSLGGYPGVQTPNLDRLAGQGILFRNTHCAAPLCNPSRTAIMTGRRPSSTGVYQNNQPYSGSKILKDAVTLNAWMRNNGYLTLGCGKIYHGTHGKFADVAGWDDYGLPKGDYQLFGPKPLAGPAAQNHFDWGPTKTGDEAMNDFHVTDWISGHLSKKHAKPLFLACGISKPHLPWYVPKKHFDLYPLDGIQLPIVKEDDLADVPEAGRRMAKPEGDHARVTRSDAWKKGVQAYLASISFADAMVGKVLRALETGPHANDTQVVLWSDHGWHLGEKSHWRKFTLWERSTRSVLMMKAPGVTKAGAKCDRPVSLQDLYPTLLALNGQYVPADLEGTSLVPWIEQPEAPKKNPVLTTFGFGNHAVRDQDWRYIRYQDGTEELYDHRSDPREWTNLAAAPAHQRRRKDLAEWLPKNNQADAPTVRETEA